MNAITALIQAELSTPATTPETKQYVREHTRYVIKNTAAALEDARECRDRESEIEAAWWLKRLSRFKAEDQALAHVFVPEPVREALEQYR